MRFACLLLLAPCLAACASPGIGADPSAPGSIPAAWHGTYRDSICSPGEVVVFLEGRDATSFYGSMYFEADANHDRATYRVEGTLEDGVLSLVQSEIEQSDDIGGASWCQGTYTLAVGASDESQALAGGYTGGACECQGTAKLTPYE